MNRALFLLVSALFVVDAHAQAIYRCVDSIGRVSYGAFACARPEPDPDTEPIPASELALGRPTNMWVAAGTPVETPNEAAHRQLVEQDLRASTALTADLSRLRRKQKPFEERKAAMHADSNRRCQTALRAALLCGNVGAQFSCGEKGFIAVPAEAGAPGVAVLRRGERIDIQRCTLQVNRGR